jgi:hypothetical protein
MFSYVCTTTSFGSVVFSSAVPETHYEAFASFGWLYRPVCLAYQPPANSTFLSEQISHQQPANNTFLSEQISTSHQPPAKRIGCIYV